MNDHFKVASRKRVEFVDTDASGGIHFTAAFRWAEETEHVLLAALGIVEVACFPRIAVHAEYKTALAFGIEFELRLAMVSIGTTSINYEWSAVEGDLTYFVGRHTVVHVDQRGRPAPVPSDLAAAFAAANPKIGSVG